MGSKRQDLGLFCSHVNPQGPQCLPRGRLSIPVRINEDFPSSSAVKNLPAMQETPVQFLGREDPLKKGWATHSRTLGLPSGSAGKESAAMPETRVQFLGWEIPWRRELLLTPLFWPGEFQELNSPRGCKESDRTDRHLL